MEEDCTIHHMTSAANPLTLQQHIAETGVHTPVPEQQQSTGAHTRRGAANFNARKLLPRHPLLTRLLAVGPTLVDDLASGTLGGQVWITHVHNKTDQTDQGT